MKKYRFINSHSTKIYVFVWQNLKSCSEQMNNNSHKKQSNLNKLQLAYFLFMFPS